MSRIRNPDDEPAGTAEQNRTVEWLVGSVSALLVAMLIVYLGYQALVSDGRPPRFAIEVSDAAQMEDGLHVVFSVTNLGDQTAAGVTVIAAAPGLDQPPEPITFDYLPAGSVRHGSFVFPDRVREADIGFRVVSYREP